MYGLRNGVIARVKIERNLGNNGTCFLKTGNYISSQKIFMQYLSQNLFMYICIYLA